MATIEYKGKTFTVDEEYGFLKNLDQWCHEWVDYVKESEGIAELTDEHWKVINMLQDYYKKNGIAPIVSTLVMATGFELEHIYELFPSGPGKGACKMAGLPILYDEPTNMQVSIFHKHRNKIRFFLANILILLGIILSCDPETIAINRVRIAVDNPLNFSIGIILLINGTILLIKAVRNYFISKP